MLLLWGPERSDNAFRYARCASLLRMDTLTYRGLWIAGAAEDQLDSIGFQTNSHPGLVIEGRAQCTYVQVDTSG